MDTPPVDDDTPPAPAADDDDDDDHDHEDNGSGNPPPVPEHHDHAGPMAAPDDDHDHDHDGPMAAPDDDDHDHDHDGPMIAPDDDDDHDHDHAPMGLGSKLSVSPPPATNLLPTFQHSVFHVPNVAAGALSEDLRNGLVSDIRIGFGGAPADQIGISLDATASTIVSGGAAITVSFQAVVPTGSPPLTAPNIAMIAAAIAADPAWVARWGATTVVTPITTTATRSIDCTSCPAQNRSSVHTACSGVVSMLMPRTPPITVEVAPPILAAMDSVGSGSSLFPPECLNTLVGLGCAVLHSPCSAGARVRVCRRACFQFQSFCSALNRATVEMAAADFAAMTNCSNPNFFPTEAEEAAGAECFDPFDPTWVQQATCNLNSPVAPAPPPAKVHLCGCGATSAETTCPAGDAKTTRSGEECFAFEGQGCTKASTVLTGGCGGELYYKWNGATNEEGTMGFFSDAGCTNASGSGWAFAGAQACSASSGVQLRAVPGGIEVVKISFSFGGALSATQRTDVEAVLRAKLPPPPTLIRFEWVGTARRAAGDTLTVHVAAAAAAPAGATQSPIAAANANADALATEFNAAGSTLKSDLETKSGTTVSPPTITRPGETAASDGSGSVVIVIVVLLLLLVLGAVGAGLAYYFLKIRKQQSPKVSKKGAKKLSDDDEDGFGGVEA